MKIKNEVERLWNWIWGKRNEVKDLDHRDVFMGHIVLEILQTSTKNEFQLIPLYNLLPIHPVNNRESTIQATKERAQKVEHYKAKILEKKKMTKEDLAEVLPSATFIRAIEDKDGTYATFEGNGRIAALKSVFRPQDEIEIEVDVYYPKKIKRSQKKLKKLRKMYNL